MGRSYKGSTSYYTLYKCFIIETCVYISFLDIFTHDTYTLCKMCIYIYMCVCVCVCISLFYIYLDIDRHVLKIL